MNIRKNASLQQVAKATQHAWKRSYRAWAIHSRNNPGDYSALRFTHMVDLEELATQISRHANVEFPKEEMSIKISQGIEKQYGPRESGRRCAPHRCDSRRAVGEMSQQRYVGEPVEGDVPQCVGQRPGANTHLTHRELVAVNPRDD